MMSISMRAEPKTVAADNHDQADMEDDAEEWEVSWPKLCAVVR